jgi:hypothetical protein
MRLAASEVDDDVDLVISPSGEIVDRRVGERTESDR